MELEKEQLISLLAKVEKKEGTNKKSIVAVSLLPLIGAIILLYYFSTRIWHAKQEIVIFKKQVESLNNQVDSLNNLVIINNKKIDSLNKIYHFLEFNFNNDFGWEPSDVVSKDSVKINISKLAHQKIIDLLNKESIDIKTNIRYYTKQSDQGTVEKTLHKSGFRNINIFNSEYFYKTPTNRINYSQDANNETIKLIAYTLLRSGLDLKVIEPYSKKYKEYKTGRNKVEKELFKENSIEISGSPEYFNKKNISIQDIEKFKK